MPMPLIDPTLKKARRLFILPRCNLSDSSTKAALSGLKWLHPRKNANVETELIHVVSRDEAEMTVGLQYQLQIPYRSIFSR
jgi:hypothetical protein